MPSNKWFRIATGALVGLLILATIATILASRRQPRVDVAEQETIVT